MSGKNLENQYPFSIEEVDEKKIKEALMRWGFVEPIFEMENIARIALHLGVGIAKAPESTVDMDKVFDSFLTLEALFNMFNDLKTLSIHGDETNL